MNDPKPVAAGLAAARSALQSRAAARVELASEDPDDVEAVVSTRWDEATINGRWAAVCPSRVLWARIPDFDPLIAAELEGWSANPAGRNLVLFGNIGAGKTHAAAAACRPLFERGLGFLFLPAGELVDLIWSRSDRENLAAVCEEDVLVIDDLASDPLSEWAAARIFTVINRRWLEENPTVVTTNRDPTDEGEAGLEAAIGPRSYSRLVGGSVVLRITGEDRRRAR